MCLCAQDVCFVICSNNSFYLFCISLLKWSLCKCRKRKALANCINCYYCLLCVVCLFSVFFYPYLATENVWILKFGFYTKKKKLCTKMCVLVKCYLKKNSAEYIYLISLLYSHSWNTSVLIEFELELVRIVSFCFCSPYSNRWNWH